MTKPSKLEYRVKKKTTYFVTRYCEFDSGASITTEGEFNDQLMADRAAIALAKTEAKSWGMDDNDPSLIYPTPKYTSEPFSDKEMKHD